MLQMFWKTVPPQSPVLWCPPTSLCLFLSHVRHRGSHRGSPSRPVHHQGERHQCEQGEPRQRHRSCHRLQEVQTAFPGERGNDDEPAIVRRWCDYVIPGNEMKESSSAILFEFMLTWFSHDLNKWCW